MESVVLFKLDRCGLEERCSLAVVNDGLALLAGAMRHDVE